MLNPETGVINFMAPKYRAWNWTEWSCWHGSNHPSRWLKSEIMWSPDFFFPHREGSASKGRVIESNDIRHYLAINASAAANLRNVIFQTVWPKLLSRKISLTWNTSSFKTMTGIRRLSPSHSNPVICWEVLAAEINIEGKVFRTWFSSRFSSAWHELTTEAQWERRKGWSLGRSPWG